MSTKRDPWGRKAARSHSVFLMVAVLALTACEGGRGVSSLSRGSEVPTGAEHPSAGPRAEFPLLGSKRGEHLWVSYCADKPDSAVLPPDPRSLVLPGLNAGLNVHFNGWWEDCHVNQPEQEQQIATCGEFRARAARGSFFLQDELPMSAYTAEEFNNTWQKWGFNERPENFDQLYTLRYGLNHAPFPNPYPLPGEDPNTTNGGSGQLPLGLRQLKDEEGAWTGMIGTAACFQCHGGQIGDPSVGEAVLVGINNLGLGNNNYDVPMAGRDASPFRGTPLDAYLPGLSVDSLFNIGIRQRGQNNAVGAFELLNTILDIDSLGLNPNPLKYATTNGVQGLQDLAHPLAHTQDTPPWWNMGSRPRKFFDSGVSNDSTRIIMAAGPGEFGDLVSADGATYRNRVEEWDQDLEAYFLTLTSPAFPGEINTALAEAGAILFHSKDLWAHEGNVDQPRPDGGNGSCASCHGAYSPRFVNDPNFLEDPQFEGVASHISTLDVIGTDAARSDMLSPTLRTGWNSTWWAYPEGTEGYTHPDDKDRLTELADDMFPLDLRPNGVCGWQAEIIGYQAPPLYGVWATAPYLHNGSVPTIEALLDSSRRSTIWQRQIQEIDGIQGFDQRFGEAYDQNALGWKHAKLACDELPGEAFLNCSPLQDEGPSMFQLVTNLLSSTVAYTGFVSNVDPTPGAFERRLVYDTRILGNSNSGHTFSDVLTDTERKAIIEYLKTL